MNETYYQLLKTRYMRPQNDDAWRASISVHLIADAALRANPNDETLYTGATVPIDTIQLPAIKMGKERAL